MTNIQHNRQCYSLQHCEIGGLLISVSPTDCKSCCQSDAKAVSCGLLRRSSPKVVNASCQKPSCAYIAAFERGVAVWRLLLT